MSRAAHRGHLKATSPASTAGRSQWKGGFEFSSRINDKEEHRKNFMIP
jgi:hypothetical protein